MHLLFFIYEQLKHTTAVKFKEADSVMLCRNADLFYFYFTEPLLEIIVLKTGLTHIQRVVFCDNKQQKLVIKEKGRFCHTC